MKSGAFDHEFPSYLNSSTLVGAALVTRTGSLVTANRLLAKHLNIQANTPLAVDFASLLTKPSATKLLKVLSQEKAATGKARPIKLSFLKAQDVSVESEIIPSGKNFLILFSPAAIKLIRSTTRPPQWKIESAGAGLTSQPENAGLFEFFRHMALPVLITNVKTGLIIFMNAAAHLLLEVEAGAAGALYSKDFYPNKAFRPIVIEKLIDDKFVMNLESPVVTRKGKIINCKISKVITQIEKEPHIAVFMQRAHDTSSHTGLLTRQVLFQQKLFSALPDALILAKLNRAGDTVTVESEFLKEITLPARKLLFFTPENQETINIAITESIEKNKIVEVLVTNKSGSQHEIYLLRISPISPTQALLVVTDETRLIVAQERLEYQQNILSQARESIIVTDLMGNVLTFNKGAENIFGYTAEEILGQPISKIYEIEDPVQLQKDLSEILNGREHWAEWKGKGKDGKEIWLDVKTVRWIDKSSGQNKGFIGVAFDITERIKQAHETEKSKRLLQAIQHVQSLYISGIESKESFDNLLLNILTITESEYGFIGEVLYRNSEPYLKTQAITNIAWDQETNDFYHRHKDSGLEFFNLQTLFGHVLVTKEPLISNSPSTDARSGGLPPGHPPLKAFLGLPIMAGAEIVGMLGLANKPGGYHEDIIQFLQPLLGAISKIFLSVRRDLESQQQQAELSKLSLVARLTESGVIITDRERRIQWVNEGFTRLTGYTLGEVLGKNPGIILQSPETRQQTILQLRENLNAGKSATAEILNIAKNGQQYWISLDIQPLYDEQNNHTGFIAVQTNVTERKIAFEELARSRTILIETGKIAKIGGWEYIVQPGTLIWSDEVYHIHEVDKTNNTMLEKALSYYAPDSRPVIEAAFHALITTGKEYDLELELVTERKNRIWVRTIGKAVYENDILVKAYGTLQDITDKKEVENSLIQATYAAEAANKAKTEFLTNMSHEIRTPLNGVIGFAELLQGTQLDSVQSELLQNSLQSANNLLDIINDILDFSKIEAGKLELEIENTDLLQLVEQSADLIKFSAHEKGVEFNVVYDASYPRYVMADKIRLRQILANLLSNAEKFTDSGEIAFIVQFTPDKDTGNGHFIFTISDTGVGMTAETVQKLFKEFSQADVSITRKYGGTGLGLAISAKLADKMNGHISVKSEINKGSVFSLNLTLPYYFEEETPDHEAFGRCLVVAPNAHTRDSAQNILARMRIPSETTDSIANLRDLPNLRQNYRAIFLDINPDIGATLDFIHEIRGQEPERQTEIILLYDTHMHTFISGICANSNIEFYCSKPLHYSEILNVIESIEKNVSTRVYHTQENDSGTHSPFVLKNLSPLIMLVEDVPMNRLLMRAVVKNLLPEAELLECNDGSEAVTAYKQHAPDLVLMDIQMPNMDGYTATRLIREAESGSGKRVPVIAVTAGTTKGERDRCIFAGMDDYIPKPVNLATVNEVFRKFLGAQSKNI